MNGPDGATVYVNQAAVRLLGAASAEEVLNGEPGAISARYRIYDEDGRPYDYRDLPAFRALAGEEHPDAKLVRNVVVATGEERWLLNKVSVLRDADGGVDRIVNVIEDVTEVKNARGPPADPRRGDPGALGRARPRAGSRGRGGGRRAGPGGLVRGRRGRPGGERRRREPAAGDERLVVGAARRRRRAGDADARPGAAVLRRGPRPGRGARPPGRDRRARRPAVGGARRDHARAAGGAAAARAAARCPGCGRRRCTARRGSSTTSAATSTTRSRPTRAGRVCIGDVAGQGARAATLTGLMRYTLRSVAQHTGGQGTAIAAVNRALTEQPELALGTLAVVRLHRGDRRRARARDRSRPATRCRCSSATAPCASSGRPVRSPGSSRTPSGR